MPGRPVQLEHIAATGQLVQPVDILRDHAAEPPRSFPAGKGAVGDVRLGGGELHMRLGPLPPVFDLRLRVAEIFVEQDRPAAGPDPAGRAKIGNAAFRADAGARKDDGRCGLGQPVGNAIRHSIHAWASSLSETERPKEFLQNDVAFRADLVYVCG